MDERIPQTEICPKCKQEKSIREFFVFLRGQYTEGGATLRERKINCRKCRKLAREKRWRASNPEKVRKNNRRYWKNKSKHNRNRIDDDG